MSRAISKLIASVLADIMASNNSYLYEDRHQRPPKGHENEWIKYWSKIRHCNAWKRRKTDEDRRNADRRNSNGEYAVAKSAIPAIESTTSFKRLSPKECTLGLYSPEIYRTAINKKMKLDKKQRVVDMNGQQEKKFGQNILRLDFVMKSGDCKIGVEIDGSQHNETGNQIMSQPFTDYAKELYARSKNDMVMLRFDSDEKTTAGMAKLAFTQIDRFMQEGEFGEAGKLDRQKLQDYADALSYLLAGKGQANFDLIINSGTEELMAFAEKSIREKMRKNMELTKRGIKINSRNNAFNPQENKLINIWSQDKGKSGKYCYRIPGKPKDNLYVAKKAADVRDISGVFNFFNEIEKDELAKKGIKIAARKRLF